MKLQLTVEVDATEDECDAVLDQLDELIEDNAVLVIGTGHMALLSYVELPAVGRARTSSCPVKDCDYDPKVDGQHRHPGGSSG